MPRDTPGGGDDRPGPPWWRRPLTYILVGRRPVPVDTLTWARWFEVTAHRRVARAVVHGVEVSTMFMGVDSSFMPDGPPILFETMVFGGGLDHEQWRYATWDEAECGHRLMCQLVRRAKRKPSGRESRVRTKGAIRAALDGGWPFRPQKGPA